MARKRTNEIDEEWSLFERSIKSEFGTYVLIHHCNHTESGQKWPVLTDENMCTGCGTKVPDNVKMVLLMYENMGV